MIAPPVNLVNLLGAPVVIHCPPAPTFRLAPVLPVPQVVGRRTSLSRLHDLPYQLARETHILHLPDPEEGVYLLVSVAVAILGAAADRWDLLSPDPTRSSLSCDGVILVRRLVAFDASPELALPPYPPHEKG
jgi:hypothetical protein